MVPHRHETNRRSRRRPERLLLGTGRRRFVAARQLGGSGRRVGSRQWVRFPSPQAPLEADVVCLCFEKQEDAWLIGSTKDLQKRISAHNSGGSRSTKHGIPWKIIYCEIGLNNQDARAREKYLKSGMGRRYLKNRLKLFFAGGF